MVFCRNLNMHVLVTCKNEDDRSKNEGARVFTRFLHYKSMGIFSRRSWAANSAVLGPIWLNFKLVRDVIDVMDILVTYKYEKDLIKMKVLECSKHFPNYNHMGAIRCHGNQSSNPTWSKPNAINPPPKDGSDKIWLNSACWLWRYLCLKV